METRNGPRLELLEGSLIDILDLAKEMMQLWPRYPGRFKQLN